MPEWFTSPVLWWFLAGAVLAVLELVMPGVLLVFFAAGAWLTAIVVSFADLPLYLEILIFLVTSLAGLVLLRRRFTALLQGRRSDVHEDGLDDDGFAGETAQVMSDISAGGRGRVRFRGTEWSAVSVDGAEMTAGERVTIVSRDGLVLSVKAPERPAQE